MLAHCCSLRLPRAWWGRGSDRPKTSVSGTRAAGSGVERANSSAPGLAPIRASALSQRNLLVNEFQLRYDLVDHHLTIDVMLRAVDVVDQALVSSQSLTPSASRRFETHWLVSELNLFSVTLT